MAVFMSKRAFDAMQRDLQEYGSLTASNTSFGEDAKASDLNGEKLEG